MRFANKYKGCDKLFSIFEKLPLRVKKFKSTKWKKIIKRGKSVKKKNTQQSRKKIRRKKSFLNSLLVKVSIRSWYRVKKYNENGRKIKNVISSLFDNSLPTKFFRKSLNFSKHSSKHASRITKIYSNTLLKPEFILGILFWRACCSPEVKALVELALNFFFY
jgi:hypothetical protein